MVGDKYSLEHKDFIIPRVGTGVQVITFFFTPKVKGSYWDYWNTQEHNVQILLCEKEEQIGTFIWNYVLYLDMNTFH